jgi:hypothetical protein
MDHGMTAQEVSDQHLVATKPTPVPALGRDRLLIGALVVLAFLLRLPNLGRAYWIDEGISVGIASHPLRQIPGLLRQDGSPPLFYAVLHFWMRIFGTSEIATHLLPLTVSLLIVPLAFWSGRVLFDRRAGVAAAALFATNPFLAWYSTETRMYTIVVGLAIVGLTLAWRSVRERSIGDATGAVLTYAALLYTHNWGIYLTVVTAAVLFGLAVSTGERGLAVGVAVAASTVVMLWLPWLPSFLSQASTTAAPWAVRPKVGAFFADPAAAIGGTLRMVVPPVLALGVYWTRRERMPSDRHVAGLIGAIGVLTALAGFLGAQLEPSWTVRYLAVIVAPLLLGAAGALTPSMRGRLLLAGVCTVLALWSIVGSLIPNPSGRYAKSNIAAVAHQMSGLLRPGDVVVVTQTEQVAVLSRYLPRGLIYLTPTGPVAEPSVVDWRNLVHRLQVADTCTAIAPTVDSLPVGARVLEINPARRLGATGSVWSKAVTAQIVAVDRMLSNDPDLTVISSAAPGRGATPFSPINAVLFLKTGLAGACA